MAVPYRTFSTKQTPQTEPIPGKDMVQNHADGFGFATDPWQRLERFLILGSEGGTYYQREQELTKENAVAVMKLIKENGIRVVDTVVKVSEEGRAYKNDPALFVLALAASSDDIPTRRLALTVLDKVARTGTHLFHFAQFVNNLRGWGRTLTRAIGNWYIKKTPDQLAYQLAKYQSRDGWCHKDLLKLSHPRFPSCEIKAAAVRWALDLSNDERSVQRRKKNGTVQTVRYNPTGELPRLLQGFEAIKQTQNPEEAGELIKKYQLPRECVPTQFLTDKGVWEALLPHMKPIAMIRNLGNMSKAGLLLRKSEAEQHVINILEDQDLLIRERVHPLQVLAALVTYSRGHGALGKGNWEVDQNIVEALDDAFYLTFKGVVPSGNKILIGFDVSGSMDCGEISGIPGMTPRMGTAAMGLVTMNTESEVIPMAFTHRFIPLKIHKAMRLDQVVSTMERLDYGGTDCALPMIYANKQGWKDIDAFVIYTDNETWAGNIHPVQALQNYRNWSGRAARLVVVGMAATSFTIADPNDAGTLDVVGFDTTAPNVISDFIAGRI